MFKKLLLVICVLSLGISAQAQTKKGKKVITTTTEEVDENGKKTIKTEKVETEVADDAPAAPKSEKWEQGSSTPPPSSYNDPTLPSINESWYTLWGLGFGSASYSGSLGDVYEDAEDVAGADRSATVSMDILGFYWPLLGHKTMLGFVFNTAGDSIEFSNGNEASISTSMLGFSAHHFFGENIGDGWFVRGDVGLARASIDFEIGSDDYDDTSDAGLGLLIGGGYALPIGTETRLLVGLYVRSVPELKFDSSSKLKGTVTSLTAGFLF
jgi:hypothetical protein